MVWLPHLRSKEDRQDQKMVLAHSADNQIRKCHKECSNHHPFLLTLRPKWLNHSKMQNEMLSYTCKLTSKCHSRTFLSS